MIRVRWTINKVGGSERRVTIEESAPAPGDLVMLNRRAYRVQARCYVGVPRTPVGKSAGLPEWSVYITTSGVRR